MLTPFVSPSPGETPDLEWRLHQIHAFWEQLYVGENPGETTWQELDALRVQVIKALAGDPPDVILGETLTAYAALLMTGLSML
jgi:hypothetical protein